MAGGVITTGSHPKALWPGIYAWFGRKYDEHEPEYPDLFEEATSDKAYEEMVEITGFGLMPVKPEGSAVVYDTEQQGAVSRFTHLAYSLGYIVTFEELQDNKYEEVSKTRAAALAFSCRQTIENVAANVWNRSFNANFIGGDGATLCSNLHPTLTGNQSNLLNTAADLSEVAIEDLGIQVMSMTNNRGQKIKFLPQSLHVPPAQFYEAQRVVHSVLQNDTANNAINVIKASGMFPKGIKVNHYFSSATAWFIRTNCPNGLFFFERHAPEFDQDNEFQTKNALAKIYTRFSVFWADWRQLFGTPGV